MRNLNKLIRKLRNKFDTQYQYKRNTSVKIINTEIDLMLNCKAVTCFKV